MWSERHTPCFRHRTKQQVAGAMTSVQTSVTAWLEIVRGELQEIPGLHLTKAQCQRLWGLDGVTRDALVDARLLERARNGRTGGYGTLMDNTQTPR